MSDHCSHLGESQKVRDAEMSPPGSIVLELGIENQLDCVIRSIQASKPRGMNIRLEPLTECWEQTGSSRNVFKRRPRFGGTSIKKGRTSKPGVCSTCRAPCTKCTAARDNAQRHREQPVADKRYLSCAYIDLPSLETYRIDIEIPTSNAEQSRTLSDDDSTFTMEDHKFTSDASTQTDGLPERISSIGIDHDVTSPVEITLQIDKEIDHHTGSSSGSSSSDDDEAQNTGDFDGRSHGEDRRGSNSSIDSEGGERPQSPTITALDQDNTVVDQDKEQPPDLFEDDDLLLSSLPTSDMIGEAEPNLFEMTQEEEDHLMRMKVVFGESSMKPPEGPRAVSMIHDESIYDLNEVITVASSQDDNLNAEQKVEADREGDQGEDPHPDFQLSDSLDITPEEFEQFLAMNAAFGSPAVIPPPKCLSKETRSSPAGPIQQESIGLHQSDNKARSLEPSQAIINLTDSLDLTQEEYEQFVAMSAAFGGPSVIPRPRMASIQNEEPSEQAVVNPVSRPLTLNLQRSTNPDNDRTPSPRSPGLSRQPAVGYFSHTDTASSVEDDSRQNSVEGTSFLDDLRETAFGNPSDDKLDSDQEEESDGDDVSLVASSQEDEGSLTPVLETSPLNFDLGVVEQSNSLSTTPTNESKKFPKGPEFTEELFLSAPTGEGYGDNAVLMRCKVEAWPPAHVSWFYKDEPLGDGDEAVDPDRVELNSDQVQGVYTLLLKEVESFDTGVYTCKASNTIGEATSAAELIVQESASDSEYETARSYFTSGDEIVDHLGETWLSRGITEANTVPKRTVKITTHGATAPRFTFKPQSRVVEIGQTAKLICGVKGSPKPHVSWFSQGMELKNEGRYRVFEGDEPGNFVLEIREIKPTDAGTYTCTAGNIIGQVYCSTDLSVEEFGEPDVDVQIMADEMSSLPVQYLQYGPMVAREAAVESPTTKEEAQPVIPQKLFAMEGEPTQLQCPVAGHERSSVTWYKDREAVVPSDLRVISESGDSHLLTFLKTQLDDEGEYTCCLTESPHTLLCSCVLIVKESKAADTDTSTSSTPVPSAASGNVRSSSIEKETRPPDLNQAKVVHTDSLEVINPLRFSPTVDDIDGRNGGSRSLHGVGHSETGNSRHGTGEGPPIKWREKLPYASPRKHKESRKNRKSSRGSKHGAESSQHRTHSRYDSSDSDSSSDSLGRSWKEKTPVRKSKPQKKLRDSFSSDKEFDTDLERIMALSDKADACLNIVNSVLEMSLDKEVDEALQEQIQALQPGLPESEGNVHQPDSTADVIVESDTDVHFIKQMAVQTVVNAIAEKMMREANNQTVEPKYDNDLPLANGFAAAHRTNKEPSEGDFKPPSKEDAQALAEINLEDIPPVRYTTTAEVEESNPYVEKEADRRGLKLDVNIPPEPAQLLSPRTSLFRGPEDKIFTLDEIIDALPESAVDENLHQSQGSASPVDKTQKFTFLGSYRQAEPNFIDGSELTDSPFQDSPAEESPPVVLTRLKDIFILEGDAMRLEVQVQGFPVPEVTWYKDGTELHPCKNLQLKFDGDDTWALIIRNILAREGGVYTCTARNKLGSTSTSAVINVAGLADGPNVTDKRKKQSLHGGNPFSPTASMSSSSAHDDDVFVTKANVRHNLPKILLSVDDSATDDITLGDSGDEDLQELTTHLTESIHLDRNSNWADNSSPDISRSNSNNSDKGTPFRLNKRNRPDSNIESIRHRKAFRKHPSRDSMTSTEPCSTGNSTSESDTEGAPKFVQPVTTREILEGQSVKLNVCVTGDPEPSVRWFHDGSELKSTGRIKCSQGTHSRNGCIWRLEISNVRTSDDGRYVCKAENSIGVKSCGAFLIVEALNAHDGGSLEEDDRIVSRLLMEREGEQSHGESSHIEEDLLKTFTVDSDYSDSGGRMCVKKGDQVELLDGRNKDRWLVRHKTNSNMIGYIPCTLLKRTPSSASEKEERKIIYNFISKQSIERRPSNSMKQHSRVSRHTSLQEGQLSELDEGKIIEDFPEPEAVQSYDPYMAVASYTPGAEQKGFISMTENQVFEVLDSNNALNWLVRGENGDVGWVPASYLTPYVSGGHNGTRRGSRSLSEERDDLEAEDGEEGDREVGSKEKEAMLKRGFVLRELLDTERDYVKDLKYVTTHFIPPIQHPNVPIILKGKKDDIFCNLQEIYDFHNTKFLHELEECENDANSIGRAFIKWQSSFIELHVKYCKNKPKADAVLTSAAKAFFLQYGGGTGPGELGLGDYLIKPVQRITKYQLLLKEIIKYTSRAKEDCQELELALNGMIEVPKRANDLMYLNLIEGFQRDVTELGKLYRQDCFSAWSGKPKGRGKERHLFLFKDILLFTKPKKEVKGDVVGYIYKSHLMVGALHVSEDQSDERRFELSSQGRLSPTTILAKTKYVKEAWVKSLRDLIAEVPRELREGKSSSERRFDHSPIIPRKRRATSMLLSGSSLSSSQLEPGLNGNFSKSTESLISLISSPTLLSIPRSGRGSIDSMTGSIDFSTFTSLVPSVGAMYEVLEDLVDDGHETKEILKGDVVKLLEVCENNLFHIQTIPTDETSPGMEGYVTPGLLKKMSLADEPPAFTDKLKPCLVSTDESAVLTCSFSGKPIPTATWSLPSHLNSGNKRVEIMSAENNSTLTLHRVTMLDAGEYTCTVENSNGSVSCMAKLDVRESQSSIVSTDLNFGDIHDISRARSSSPLTTHSLSVEEPSMVRSTSLENLKTLDEDFDVLPGEIVRASSVSGRGMLNSSKKSGKDKIGSFRKHIKKAFSTAGMEKDKIFANLQRSQSGSSLQKSKHQQRSTTCIHCKALRDDAGEDGLTVCEMCAQRAMASSQETLMEEEEDAVIK
ncbi:uncharacterized protein LOC110986244 isoform X2 [Acanthaster planci]|uniref:Uncharacterized protein LOC110986244 isoform X2 n=1 Tax=Acanthaster planci TaxID=133434 RepID=A0A8B7ZDC8_ACAPL|nr:uncharacterized protein LOC110986244 isoform X2 [Acanthaster planci]